MTAALTTLVIDVGGSGLKATVLDADGAPLHERVRVPTEYPCPPARLIGDLWRLVADLPSHERVSVGFPGVVRGGMVRTAPHFVTLNGPGTDVDPELVDAWTGFRLADALEEKLGLPVRVGNDADVQGAGAMIGQGLELILTLGTGLGSAMFRDGRLGAHLELAHHRASRHHSYNGYVGDAARRRRGRRHWNRNVRRALVAIDALLQPDSIMIGGGNAEHVDLDDLSHKFPDVAAKVRIVGNQGGLLGGIRLWDDIGLG